MACVLFIFLPSVVRVEEKIEPHEKEEEDKVPESGLEEEQEKLALDSEIPGAREEAKIAQNKTKLVPSVKDAKTKKKTPKEVIRLVLQLAKDPRMRKLMPFICMSGLMQGIPSLALYRITTRALPGETNVEINKKISLTMAVLGALGVASG